MQEVEEEQQPKSQLMAYVANRNRRYLIRLPWLDIFYRIPSVVGWFSYLHFRPLDNISVMDPSCQGVLLCSIDLVEYSMGGKNK